MLPNGLRAMQGEKLVIKVNSYQLIVISSQFPMQAGWL